MRKSNEIFINNNTLLSMREKRVERMRSVTIGNKNDSDLFSESEHVLRNSVNISRSYHEVV